MGMFGGEGSRNSQLSGPWGLSLDANGNIIVADSGNKLIKIFSTNGKFVRKIGGPDSFSWPIHCVQCDEYLIEYKFGQQGGGDGEFNYPRCMAVSKSKHLLVCDGGNDRIQVFELNGRFVGKFGTKGSNLGEFDDLKSVAVFNSGRIVVSEWGNYRIQMFE